jgi:LemA protein
MNSKYIRWAVIGGIILIVFLWIRGSYNGLIKEDVTVQTAWSNVETQYQRRYDLIENLAKTVLKAAKTEDKILKDVIEARAQATSVKIDASSLTEENMAKFEAAQARASQSLNSSLSRLMVVSEQYPDLKSVPQFAKLNDEIAGTENRIGTARTDFNQAIMNYNLRVRSFPSNIFANIFGFQLKAAFKATEGSDKAPDLDKVYDKE